MQVFVRDNDVNAGLGVLKRKMRRMAPLAR
jgi:hypothetical protein